jgi:hypothetical protein
MPFEIHMPRWEDDINNIDINIIWQRDEKRGLTATGSG